MINETQFSLEFRTFAKEAVMLMVDKPLVNSYVGLFLQNGGKLRLNLLASGEKLVGLETAANYNDGKWYQVWSWDSINHLRI